MSSAAPSRSVQPMARLEHIDCHEWHSLDDPNCGICTEKYDNEHSSVKLDCDHTFGQNCVEQWFQNLQRQNMAQTCPMCRRTLCEASAPGLSEAAELAESQRIAHIIRELNEMLRVWNEVHGSQGHWVRVR